MFSVNNGWLRYKPHEHFFLPTIVEASVNCKPLPDGVDPIKVPICDQRGDIRDTKTLYRLKWPGECRSGNIQEKDKVPSEILGNLNGWERLGRQNKDASFSIWELMNHETISQKLTLPKMLPASIAYHLAVNADIYFPETYGSPESLPTEEKYPHPVGALDHNNLNMILGARFALDGHVLASLQYLKWMAEGHWDHPLLRGFDTLIGDELLKVSSTCTRLYFWLLGDYIYSLNAKYWDHSEQKYHWWRLAGYMFWLGRVGDLHVDTLAVIAKDVDISNINPNAKSLLMGRGSNATFAALFPDFLERLNEWHDKYNCMRRECATKKQCAEMTTGEDQIAERPINVIEEVQRTVDKKIIDDLRKTAEPSTLGDYTKILAETMAAEKWYDNEVPSYFIDTHTIAGLTAVLADIKLKGYKVKAAFVNRKCIYPSFWQGLDDSGEKRSDTHYTLWGVNVFITPVRIGDRSIPLLIEGKNGWEVCTVYLKRPEQKPEKKVNRTILRRAKKS